MRVRIDITCWKCHRVNIDTLEVPNETLNLHILCRNCDEEVIIDFPLVHYYGRCFGDGIKVTTRVDKL
jgi:hypothetical protein